MVKRAPDVETFSTVMRPSWASMMPIQRLSPSPVPSPTGFVVKNGSNTWRRCSGGMPGPLSSTTILTPFPLSAVRTVSTPSRPLALMAWAAFVKRLRSTCCSWYGSAEIFGSVDSSSATARTRLSARSGPWS